MTYLLHDTGHAKTTERVAWTHTMNLATSDASAAARLMAYVAMDADRLKKAAGVPLTGRKSNKSVKHISVSWPEEQREDITRDEMIACAQDILKALGANDHQAVIVGHNDAKPHFHIVLNRISTENGVMLPSSKEKEKLSEWALEYERRGGKIYCPKRLENWERRNRRLYTRGKKHKARSLMEAERLAPRGANDNKSASDRLREKHRKKSSEIGKRERALKARQAAEWVKLETEHKRRRRTIIGDFKRRTYKAVDRVVDRYAESWRALRNSQAMEMAEWDERERSLIGRMRNIYKAADLHARIRGEKRGNVITRSYNALLSGGARISALQAAHRAEAEALRDKEDREIAKLRRIKATEIDFALDVNADAFLSKRGTLLTRHERETAVIKAAWRDLAAERKADWLELERTVSRRKGFSLRASKEQTQENPVLQEQPDQRSDAKSTRRKVKRMDLGKIIRQSRRSDQRQAIEQNNEQTQDRGRDRDD